MAPAYLIVLKFCIAIGEGMYILTLTLDQFVGDFIRGNFDVLVIFVDTTSALGQKLKDRMDLRFMLEVFVDVDDVNLNNHRFIVR